MNYPDDSLRYCLADGTTLTDTGVSESTMARQVAASPPPPPPYQPAATVRGSSGFNVALVGIGIGILVLLALGVGGLLYFYVGRGETAENKPASVTKPDDKDEQIANLKRQLSEDRKTGQTTNMPVEFPLDNDQPKSARVNSPRDLFLALRSEPNTITGYQIIHIPHGRVVMIGACNDVTRIGRKSGKWCRASYDGSTGWVFDAFLIYQ